MPKRGIHPVMNTVTAVLRNGATFQFQSVIKAARPMRLQIVRLLPSRYSHSDIPTVPFPFPAQIVDRVLMPTLASDFMHQDPTSHPTWTGEKATLSSQEGRAAEFLRKFGQTDSQKAGDQ